MDPLRWNDFTTARGYRLLGALGNGGMGRVYLGQSATGVQVAVKFIQNRLTDEDHRRRFAREAEVLKSAMGLSVAQFADANVDEEPPWIATEYVPGLNLADHIDKYGPLTFAQAAMLGARLSEGLGAIHNAGLLHRDLKPHNVMLGPDGPKIIDFGLAVLAERTPSVDISRSGVQVGTVRWASPEQDRGDRDLTASTDAYSLGLTVAFAATGLLPPPRKRLDTNGITSPLASVLSNLTQWEADERLAIADARDQFVGLATHARTLDAAVADLITVTYHRPTDPAAIPEPNDDLPEPVESPAPGILRDRVPPSQVRAARAADRIRDDYAKTGEL